MTLHQLRAKLEAQADEFDRLEALVPAGRLCRSILQDLEMLGAEAAEILSMQEASQYSGYSEDHLARLVKQGKLPTLRLAGSRARYAFRRATFRRSRAPSILATRVCTTSPAASRHRRARRPTMADPSSWTKSFGTQRGSRVRVYERTPGGTLCVSVQALLSVAQEVHPSLYSLIILAWRTGRRLSSILNLQWEDVDFEKGTIHWRAEHDKIRQTWVVPMQREIRAELVQFRKEHPGIGPSLLFPHPQRRRRRSGPVTRHVAAWWLKEAFRRGKLEKPSGSLWHMFRRAWATERKDLPLKDVAAVGGWRDTSTLLRYQQPEARTMRAVVDFERPPETSPTPDRAASNSHSYSHTSRK